MDIKSEVQKLIKLYETNDPFKIARYKKIIVLFENLGNVLGFHNYDSRSHFIHINQNLDECKQRFTCAHELGHVIFHPKDNISFLKNVTTCPPKGFERTAHTFAVELLLLDELIQEYPDHSMYTLGKMVGVPEKLIDLKKFA